MKNSSIIQCCEISQRPTLEHWKMFSLAHLPLNTFMRNMPFGLMSKHIYNWLSNFTRVSYYVKTARWTNYERKWLFILIFFCVIFTILRLKQLIFSLLELKISSDTQHWRIFTFASVLLFSLAFIVFWSF